MSCLFVNLNILIMSFRKSNAQDKSLVDNFNIRSKPSEQIGLEAQDPRNKKQEKNQ